MKGRSELDLSLQNQGFEDSAVVPCISLLALDGIFNCLPVRVLNDDRCTSNVWSRKFASANELLLTFSPLLIDVNHSKQVANEIANAMIANGAVFIGSYSYSGNWIGADCRYDVVLGMSWHTEETPEAD